MADFPPVSRACPKTQLCRPPLSPPLSKSSFFGPIRQRTRQRQPTKWPKRRSLGQSLSIQPVPYYAKPNKSRFLNPKLFRRPRRLRTRAEAKGKQFRTRSTILPPKRQNRL